MKDELLGWSERKGPRLLDVFESPGSLALAIKSGECTVRRTLFVGLAVAILYLIFFLGNLNLVRLWLARPEGAELSFWGSLLYEQSIIFGIDFLIVIFLFIVFSKVARTGVSVNNMFLLILYLYLIPLVVQIVFLSLNYLSFYVFSYVAEMNIMFLNYVVGQAALCTAAAFGIKTLGETSLKRASCAVLPVLVILVGISVFSYLSLLGQAEGTLQEFLRGVGV